MKKLIFLSLLIPSLCFGVGKIQNEDVKSLAELTGGGGSAAQLINDSKIYLTGSINEQFSAAIADGSFARAASLLTTKGDLLGYSTQTIRVPVGSDGQVLTADSGASAGFSWAATGTAPTSPNEAYNLGLKSAAAANALTITLTQADGSSAPSGGAPVKVAFRGTSATPGNYDELSVTSSIAVTVSSGSTLGTVDATPANIYIYLLNNAGTAEVAVSSRLFDEGVLQSTIAEGGAGAADSAIVLYSTTARTNVPIKLIGRLSITEATAGTWASNATVVSPLTFKPHTQVFNLSSGSFVVPDGVHVVNVIGCGGGGGGGGGTALSGTNSTGGSGGAGSAPLSVQHKVNPGDTLTVTLGAAGTAGTGGTHNIAANAGGAGGDTTVTGPGINDYFPGASGGLGGGTTAGSSGAAVSTYNTSITDYPTAGASGAGSTVRTVAGSNAANTFNHFVSSAGAAGGAICATPGANCGLAGGGGGGGFGVGGAGGQAGNNSSTGVAGSNSPNSCGGGGGAGGWGITAVGTGVNGGAGGAGAVYITY